MRRIPIRMKLAGALAVPLIGLFFITVVEVAETAADVDDVRAQTELARASVGPSGVITGIQNERTWAVVELIGQENAVQAPVVGYEESRRVTDEAITAFRETLESGPGAASDAYAEAMGNLDQLDELRETIDAVEGDRDLSKIEEADDVYQRYKALIQPFLDANSRVALAIDDAELRQATTLVDVTTRQLEVLSELARTSILEITVGGGLDNSSEIAEIARLRSTFDNNNRRLLEAPTPFDTVVRPEYPDGLVDGFSAELDKALTGDQPDMASMLATLNVPADAGYMGVRDALVESLNDRAVELNDAAERRERTYVALAVATLVVAVGLTWAVSRSITRPLRALTRQAKDMADHRLPDAVTDILDTPLGENITVPQVPPVRIRTRDEVSDVAEALNTVQDTALDLAVEQAVLRRNIADSFVNLGRRNQNLLGRQLDFITELEANETSPDALSNLFRLDHLATRMRRNAESLLVLAGIEPPRQWAAPVRLTDVIRAALGEVENYQRVTVRGVEPATIIGSAAADLAHLLAELIENALVFSPPDQSVDIRGRLRDDGAYTLAVIDTGLGMAPKDLTAANRRLAGAESFTVAPSKYLGHYVAGNLAARHGIEVRLDTSPGQGITATLTVPPGLLTTEQVTSAPVTPPHGQRAVAAARALATPQAGPLPARPGPADTPVAPAAPSSTPWPMPAPAHGAPAAAPAAAWPPEPAGPDTGAWQVPATDPTAPWPHPPHPDALPPLPGRTGGDVPAAAPAPLQADASPTPEPLTGGLWPRAGGPRVLGGPQAGASRGDADFGRTPGGLTRRAPAQPQSPTAAPLDDQTLLQALGRYAPPSDAGATPPAAAPRVAAPPPATPPPLAPRAPVAPPAAPAPPPGGASRAPRSFAAPPSGRGPAAPPAGHAAPSSPLTPADALARRVPGAQLPQAAVIPLRGGPPPPGSRLSVDPRPTPAGGASKATDVQALLSSFTAGVQRGLAEAQERAQSTVDAGGPGGR